MYYINETHIHTYDTTCELVHRQLDSPIYWKPPQSREESRNCGCEFILFLPVAVTPREYRFHVNMCGGEVGDGMKWDAS